jgi:hypothetical protein
LFMVEHECVQSGFQPAGSIAIALISRTRPLKRESQVMALLPVSSGSELWLLCVSRELSPAGQAGESTPLLAAVPVPALTPRDWRGDEFSGKERMTLLLSSGSELWSWRLRRK